MNRASHPRADRVTAARVGLAVAILLGGSLALFWPGYVTYDGVAQYAQALTEEYDDWHPPIMARLWALFGAHGAAPMLVVQMLLYWLGFAALAVVLTAQGRRLAALTMLAIAVWPPLLGWQAVVIKDAQMLAALLAAVAVIGWWRLRSRRVPPVGWAIAALLVGYALLVRANAVFAVVPLAAWLAIPPRRVPLRLAAIGVAVPIVLGLAGPINHGLLAASASGVERTQAIYDLAGIAVATGDPATGIAPAGIARLRGQGCVRPFFWDTLGDGDRCGSATAPLRAMPVGPLYGLLGRAILHHPVAYAGHRLHHLNSTERWLVPLRWYGAAPPEGNEANDLGLVVPGAAAKRWQQLATMLVETPLGWPVVWSVLAVLGLVATWGARDPAGGMAAALFASAVGQEASFAVISIASDLRYHLWAMTATAIGWVLLGRPPRGHWAWGVLIVVTAAGVAARSWLPQAPSTYVGMLG
jgi:hypothetical protein